MHVASLKALLCAVGAASIAAPAVAQTYLITDLGSLGSGFSQASAQGINASGQIVGYAQDANGLNHAFVWSAGTMTQLVGLSSNAAKDNSQALAINDAGQVAGVSLNPTPNQQHAVVWNSGVATDLSTLAGASGASAALGINASGTVAGVSVNASGTQRAFTWTSGTLTDLGSLQGATGFAQANAINASGIVVGASQPAAGGANDATLWNGTTLTDLTATAALSTANAINAAGQVAGTSGTSAALWQAGTTTVLAPSSTAYALNSSGQAVGSATSGTGTVAALFSGGKAVNLNTLVDPASPNAATTTLIQARGINDAGQIIVNGAPTICAPPTCNAQNLVPTHAYLLTPETVHLTATPSSLDFGSLPVGGAASPPQAIGITNTGTTAFGVNKLVLPADYSSSSNCPLPLPAGASCVIQVTFSPVALGTRAATAAVGSGGTTIPVALTGQGLITARIQASPTSALLGTPVTLSWSSTAGSACTATGGGPGDGWSGTLPASGTRTVTETASATYVYGLTCTGSGQTAQAQATVTVGQVAVTLTSSKSSSPLGTPVSLTWSAPFASTCTGAGGTSTDGWSGPKTPATGGQVLVAETVPGNYTYTITCVAGTHSAQAQVLVAFPLPTATLTSNQSTLTAGEPLTLSWRSSNATQCVASGGLTADHWAGPLPTTSGQLTVTSPSAATVTYTLTCTADGQQAQSQLPITYTVPVVTLTPSTTSIAAGGTLTLAWSSTYAATCTATGGASGDGWAGSRTLSGHTTVTVSAAATYTLTCTSGSQSTKAEVSVTLQGPGSSGGGGGAWDAAALLGLVALGGLRSRCAPGRRPG